MPCASPPQQQLRALLFEQRRGERTGLRQRVVEARGVEHDQVRSRAVGGGDAVLVQQRP
ncbi:hypothetical protein [Nocardia xishanensis]|uniref:Uncharacterized protein n=1 Tax=Nocardia xishanensis TaxID=238964 RepID=A0ABW7WTK9_9NOCA